MSLVRTHKKRTEGDILQGEIKKIKLTTFNGENRKVEEDEV
jgi:hypothetical protein